MPNESHSKTPLTDFAAKTINKPYGVTDFVIFARSLELKLRETTSLIERQSAHLVEGGEIMDEFVKEHQKLQSQLAELRTIANELADEGHFHTPQAIAVLDKLEAFNRENP